MPNLQIHKPRSLMSAGEILEDNRSRMQNAIKDLNPILNFTDFPANFRRAAAEIEMMQQLQHQNVMHAFHVNIICQGVCEPSRPARKHVDSRIVAPKQLTGHI